MSELEKSIEKKLKDMVERRGGLCLKWTCPGWSGVPDRIVLMPDGRVYFVELKRPKGGKLDPLQEWWAKRLQGLGFECLSVKNKAELAAFELHIRQGQKTKRKDENL